MVMEPDFPAAHSMDSSWYAIDKNGHVALFDTGAGGAIPNGAYSPDAEGMMVAPAEAPCGGGGGGSGNAEAEGGGGSDGGNGFLETGHGSLLKQRWR